MPRLTPTAALTVLVAAGSLVGPEADPLTNSASAQATATTTLPLMSTTAGDNEAVTTISTSAPFVGDDTETQTLTLAGDIAISLQRVLSGAGSEIVGVEFVGGGVSFSDATFVLTATNFGTYTVTVNTVGVAGTTNTPSGVFEPVSMGMFNTAQHEFIVDQGVADAEIVFGVQGVPPQVENDTQDFSAEPITSMNAPGTLGTLSAVFAGNSGGADRFDIEVRFPATLMDSFTDSSGFATGTIDIDGTIAAAGQIAFPCPGDADMDCDADADDILAVLALLATTSDPGQLAQPFLGELAEPANVFDAFDLAELIAQGATNTL